MSEYKSYLVKMGKAKCAIDLGDGSERGEYVNQDYVLSRLGRPVRSVCLMYCYYPNDKYWPKRISEAVKDKSIAFQWDYPYDDYFIYKGGLGGTLDDEPFTFMRDVRRHGQEVKLTITMDPFLDDEHIIAIAKDLRTFGRIFLRVNHEATGDWFSFNKRASYQEVADFYCRVAKLVHEYAPNVQMVLCLDGVKDITTGEMLKEKEFTQAIIDADLWSVDKYMALDCGWPFNPARIGSKTHFRRKASLIYDLTKLSYEAYVRINGGNKKPMHMSEFNADGNITGPYEQCEMVEEFCCRLKEENANWLDGLSFYQFRDRGRLGLEIQDPNNADVGIEQPIMKVFKKIIHDDYFKPLLTKHDEIDFPIRLRWGSSEDAEGICVKLHFEGNPCFCELKFSDDSNLIIEFNGKWFYKSPKSKFVDLMPAFFEKPLDEKKVIELNMFAPPASGENDISTEDGMYNSYSTINSLPEIRIEYEPIEQ